MLVYFSLLGKKELIKKGQFETAGAQKRKFTGTLGYFKKCETYESPWAAVQTKPTCRFTLAIKGSFISGIIKCLNLT